MGALPEGNRRYNLRQLSAVHMEILRRHFIGQKSVEIAEALGLSQATVSYTINNPLARELLEQMQAGALVSVQDVQTRLKELAFDAVDVLEEMVTEASAPPALRVRAAQDVLDRAGYGAVKKVEGRLVHGLFTSDEIAALVQRAKGPMPTEVPCEVQSE